MLARASWLGGAAPGHVDIHLLLHRHRYPLRVSTSPYIPFGKCPIPPFNALAKNTDPPPSS
jgi:hypothetical protein